MKPEHKFFERQLTNDLDSLYDFLDDISDKIVDENLLNVPDSVLVKFNKVNGAPTQLGTYYNVFSFDHPGIASLKDALKSMVAEAAEYYSVSPETKFYLTGWFNLDFPTVDKNFGVNPLRDSRFFHDHMNGEGAPVFHGYYCVNAEPSVTYYDIDKTGNIFENVNKNNRAILSETGHPHGRDDWFEDKPRITIAYDITPHNFGGLWIDL